MTPTKPLSLKAYNEAMAKNSLFRMMQRDVVVDEEDEGDDYDEHVMAERAAWRFV